jgi:PilZ domain
VLEVDSHEELNRLLAQTACEVEVPQSLRSRLARRGVQAAMYEERRQFTRFAFLTKTLLEVTTSIKCIERPEGRFAILTTDVSRDGVAFLHVGQLFPGEVVSIWFPTGKLACRVMRCTKHNASCFEIGATFVSGPQPQTWLRTLHCGHDVEGQ